MRNLLICFFIFLNFFSIGQNEPKKEKNITYKVQIISSDFQDSTKFKYFLEEYNCEIKRNKSKVGDKWIYLITPKENTLYSANVLLDETFYHYQNPFIVVYYKGKRQK